MAARTSTATDCARPVRRRQSSLAASPVAAITAAAAVPIRTSVGSIGSSPVRLTRSRAAASPPTAAQTCPSACRGVITEKSRVRWAGGRGAGGGSGDPFLPSEPRPPTTQIGNYSLGDRRTARRGQRPTPRPPSAGPPSDDSPLGEIGDLLLRVTDRRQDRLVVLPQLGRRGADREPPLAVRDRVSENGQVAQLR